MASSSHSESNERGAAFELAGRIRRTREFLVESLRAGAVDLRKVLESEDPLIRTIKVVTVVENLPGLGKVKARRILDEVGVSANLKIEHLDSDQRSDLLERIEAPTRSDAELGQLP